MVVGICRLDLYIHGSASLKDKRQVLKSVKDRIRNRFNASIAEVADHDKWQRGVLGFSMIGNDKNHLDAGMQGILSLLDGVAELQVLNSDLQFL